MTQMVAPLCKAPVSRHARLAVLRAGEPTGGGGVQTQHLWAEHRLMDRCRAAPADRYLGAQGTMVCFAVTVRVSASRGRYGRACLTLPAR